jgi:hypothetical protein
VHAAPLGSDEEAPTGWRPKYPPFAGAWSVVVGCAVGVALAAVELTLLDVGVLTLLADVDGGCVVAELVDADPVVGLDDAVRFVEELRCGEVVGPAVFFPTVVGSDGCSRATASVRLPKRASAQPDAMSELRARCEAGLRRCDEGGP